MKPRKFKVGDWVKFNPAAPAMDERIRAHGPGPFRISRTSHALEDGYWLDIEERHDPVSGNLYGGWNYNSNDLLPNDFELAAEEILNEQEL